MIRIIRDPHFTFQVGAVRAWALPPPRIVLQVPLLFRLDARDPLRQKKSRFWRMDGPEQRRVRVCVGDTDAFRGALSMLRIIVADAAEMVVVEGESCQRARAARHPPAALLGDVVADTEEWDRAGRGRGVGG